MLRFILPATEAYIGGISWNIQIRPLSSQESAPCLPLTMRPPDLPAVRQRVWLTLASAELTALLMGKQISSQNLWCVEEGIQSG